MAQNPNTPPSNQTRNRNNDDNPFTLNAPIQEHPSFDSPPNLSFTQMLQQPYPQPQSYPQPQPSSHVPYQPLFQGGPQPNMFATPYVPNPYQYNPQPQPYPQPQPQPCPQPRPSQVESVPETQPAAPKRKHKKGKGKGKETSSQRQNWDEKEEACLTRAWISVSEDGMRGNAQSNEAFWERVLAHFHQQMGRGEYRNHDQVTSKWRELLRQCTSFNGIYNNCLRQWESGKKDFDILTAAITEYTATHNMKGFTHIEAWKVMQAGPKWVLHPAVLTSSGSNKRSRSSFNEDFTHYSDARTSPIDLNDDVDESFSELNRPDGRDKARDEAAKKKSKGKQTATSSRRSVSNREEELDYFKGVFNEHLTLSKKKLEIKEDLRSRQQVETDLRMLSMPTEGIPDENREVIEKVQKTIRDRMKSLFKF